MNEIQLHFSSDEQVKMFVKWFMQKGVDQFTLSSYNDPVKGGVTCLAADEKMEWGHYFEME